MLDERQRRQSLGATQELAVCGQRHVHSPIPAGADGRSDVPRKPPLLAARGACPQAANVEIEFDARTAHASMIHDFGSGDLSTGIVSATDVEFAILTEWTKGTRTRHSIPFLPYGDGLPSSGSSSSRSGPSFHWIGTGRRLIGC
jgi:hypothetical protein